MSLAVCPFRPSRAMHPSIAVVRFPESSQQLAWQIAVPAAAALLVTILPALRAPRRLLVVGVASVAAMLRGAFPAYAILAATIYLVARQIMSAPGTPQARWRRAVTLMVLLGVIFVVGRAWQAERYGTEAFGVSWAVYFLDMWMLLRLVNFLWETGSGRVRAIDPLTYALWAALPFTLFGPLLRFSEFQSQVGSLAQPSASGGFGDATWWRRVALALGQLVVGLLIVVLIDPWLMPGGVERVLLGGFVFLPWRFYLLSAGTFTLMECLARAWGLTLPRSFDRAFGRPNIAEFWAHWNMSATAMFRDYLFYNRWGRRTMNVYLNVVVLFLMVGVWHASTAYWILWGLLHGTGFAAYLWYKRVRATPAGARLATIPRPLARAGTYVYVCACWMAPPQIIKLISRVL